MKESNQPTFAEGRKVRSARSRPQESSSIWGDKKRLNVDTLKEGGEAGEEQRRSCWGGQNTGKGLQWGRSRSTIYARCLLGQAAEGRWQRTGIVLIFQYHDSDADNQFTKIDITRDATVGSIIFNAPILQVKRWIPTGVQRLIQIHLVDKEQKRAWNSGTSTLHIHNSLVC